MLLQYEDSRKQCPFLHILAGIYCIFQMTTDLSDLILILSLECDCSCTAPSLSSKVRRRKKQFPDKSRLPDVSLNSVNCDGHFKLSRKVLCIDETFDTRGLKPRMLVATSPTHHQVLFFLLPEYFLLFRSRVTECDQVGNLWNI